MGVSISVLKPISAFKSSLLSGRGFTLGLRDPECNLLEILSINYIEKLFEHELPNRDKVASQYIEVARHITRSFTAKLKKVLENSSQHDLCLSLIKKLNKLEGDYINPWFTDEYQSQQRLYYKEMLELFILVSGIEQFDESLNIRPPFKSISALLDATDYWNTPANSHWHWPEKYNQEPLLETLGCICELASIDVIELGNEAHYFIKKLENEPDLHFYNYIPHIDTFFSWEDCKKLNPNSQLLSQAMFFTQDWVRYSAAHLLYNGTDKLTLLELLRTALLEPQNKSSMVFTLIALAIGEEGEDVILGVFTKLEEHAKEFVLQVFNETDEIFNKKQMVRFALEELVSDEETAYQAAKLIDRLYSADIDKGAIEVIENAYNHWKIHETPYPEGGGVVPESPRDYLLPILMKDSVMSFEEAVAFLADERGEIVKTGKEGLQALLAKSSENKTMLIEAAVNGTVPFHYLVDAINSNIDLDKYQISLICNLISSPNASFRRSAMSILKEKYLSLDAINEYLNCLINDEEQEIRVKAGELQYLLSV